MFLFRYAEIHKLDYDSSRNLEVKASAERPLPTCCLQAGLSVLGRLWDAGDRV